MRASVKATTFKSINAKRSKESCRNPDLNVLPEMELEFIEKLAHWQHVMVRYYPFNVLKLTNCSYHQKYQR